jgi:small-conductance mechanosensitive channel
MMRATGASMAWLAWSAAPVGAQDLPILPPEAAPVEAAPVEAVPPIQPAPSENERDQVIEERLRSIFDQVEELDGVQATAVSGVVHLVGTAPTAEAIERAGELAGRIEGVVFVDNDIQQPDEVRDRLAPAAARLRELGREIVSFLPLLAIGLAVLAAFWGLSRWVRRSDWLIAWMVRRPLLRDVVQQFVSTAILLLGALLALEVVQATALVGAMLGAAGLVGLALGFAFRDIAENYLASILLGVRRPFGANDVVRIGEHEGMVNRLTMRDTILLTFDGNHIRLPNSMVFKSVVINYSANPLRRFEVRIGVGPDQDLGRAQSVGTEALVHTPGVAATPPAAGFVDRLRESSIELVFFGWVNQRDFDWFKVRSEAHRSVKVAFDEAGIDVPPPIYRVMVAQTEREVRPSPEQTSQKQTHQVAADSYLEDQLARDRRISPEENLLDPPA